MLDDELVTIWLDSIDRVAPDAYKTVAFDALPPEVRGDSSLWSERFFTAAANPHNRKAVVQWSYHLATADTPDVLRCEYSVQKYDLDVIETRSYVITRIRVNQSPNREAILAAAEDIDAIEQQIRALIDQGKTLVEARRQLGYHQLQSRRS